MEENRLITARRSEVEQEIAKLESRLRQLGAELEELDMAARVIARLSGATFAEERKEERSGTSSSTKPEWAPTVPVMISTVLQRASAEGLVGMEPKVIARKIEAEWWPGVRSDKISAIVWRMWKRGQLEKVGDTSTYRLPGNEKAPTGDDPEGAFSEVTDEDAESSSNESQDTGMFG